MSLSSETSPSRSPYKADLLLLLVTIIAAAGWIFSKEAMAGMPPLLFIGSRFLLAGLILAIFDARSLGQLPTRRKLRASGVGVLFGGAMACWSLGVALSEQLGVIAFINSFGILLVPVLARLLFKDRPPLSTWIALPTALLGFALLGMGQPGATDGFTIEPAQWLIFGAACLFALVFNFNSRLVRNIPALPLTAIQLMTTGITCLVLSALSESWPTGISLDILSWFLASTLIASTLRFFLQIHAQSLTTPSHASVILMLEAVWAALMSAAWFGERMTLIQMTGCGLIFTALLINRWQWISRLWRQRRATS